MNCGTCVDLPEPVGAWMTTHLCDFITRAKSARRETMGSSDGFKPLL
jgi:hypothetical protein